ncbi:EamA family transporter [Faecalicoccus acidiformans]|uniref:EamA family transporter n=1 Tax=Faecalicoccus acidiformans TaxID=915173 RepID=UPI003CC8335A
MNLKKIVLKNKFQILISAIIYGFIPALSVNLINNGMSPVIVSLYRYLLGIPFLLFLWNKSKNNTLLSLSEFIKSVFFCVIPAAVTMLFLNISYKYISPVYRQEPQHQFIFYIHYL